MSDTTQPQSQETPQQTPVLYDADAPQRVPFKAQRKGRFFKVVHIFAPITDEDLLEYERSKKVLLSEADDEETDDTEATGISSDLYKPALDLWAKRATGVENYSLKNPDNWKKEVAEGDRAYAINGVLLALQFVPPPVASDNEACPAEDDDISIYTTQAMFDGKVTTHEHSLRRAKPEEMQVFHRIMSKVHLVQGNRFGEMDQRIPSRMDALAQLYKKVLTGVAGYQGRVPKHHAMAVALRHFRSQHKLDRGNS